MQKRGGFSARAAAKLHTRYQLSLDAAEEDLDELRSRELDHEQEFNQLMLKCLSVEKAFLRETYNSGHLTETTYRQLVYTINLQADGLRYHGELPNLGWQAGEGHDRMCCVAQLLGGELGSFQNGRRQVPQGLGIDRG